MRRARKATKNLNTGDADLELLPAQSNRVVNPHIHSAFLSEAGHGWAKLDDLDNLIPCRERD